MKTPMVLLLIILLMSFCVQAEIGNQKYTGPVKFPIFQPTDDTDEDSLFFHEDFESGMNGWTTVDLTVQENEWNPDPFNAYEGNSWWCGDSNAAGMGYMGYDNFWLQYMDTPVLDLSGTSNPTLTFKVYWSVESPFTVPPLPPYDAWDGCTVWISTDGGSNFSPISPVTPVYNCASLSSIGTVWGMGPNIPGWADQSNAWMDAEFDLSSYIGPNVIVRFSLCSDRAVASSTGHPELMGFFVDDVEVTDGGNQIYFNNADDPPVGGDFTFEQGPPFGDHWEMIDQTSYSPDHCMRVDDDNFYINDALVSPEYLIPEDYTTWFKYAVLCNLPDSTHGTSTSLRDYYFVDITTDGGENWEEQFYDYARGYCFQQWAICAPDTPYTGNMSMDLTQYAGESIQIRFRCVTDGDHTSGNGAGLMIDDLWIEGSNMQADDCGATSLHVPFPTTVGHPVDCSVELHNYGLNNQSSVPAFFSAGDDFLPLVPWSAINSSSFIMKEFVWTPTAVSAGAISPFAYTQLLGDMNANNDTTFAGETTVLEDYFYELGFDNRMAVYSYEFDPGEGALVKFIRPNFVQETLIIEDFKVMFNGDLPGSVNLTLHVYDQGTPTTPGAEIFTDVVTVEQTQTYPNWWTEHYGYSYYIILDEEFWVWLEITDGNAFPHPLGHDRMWGEGHYYNYNGSSATLYSDDLMIRLITAEGQISVGDDPELQPLTFSFDRISPNPFNNQSSLDFTIAAAGQVRLTVYDITGREAGTLQDGIMQAGKHRLNWNANGLASGIYFVELQQGNLKAVKKAVLLK